MVRLAYGIARSFCLAACMPALLCGCGSPRPVLLDGERIDDVYGRSEDWSRGGEAIRLDALEIVADSNSQQDGSSADGGVETAKECDVEACLDAMSVDSVEVAPCTPGGCDDGNECTFDECDPTVGCIYSNNCRLPGAWDHPDRDLATSMGPGVRHIWDHPAIELVCRCLPRMGPPVCHVWDHLFA